MASVDTAAPAAPYLFSTWPFFFRPRRPLTPARSRARALIRLKSSAQPPGNFSEKRLV